MSKVILKATTRDVTGKEMRATRTVGQLPVVVYGHNIAPRNLWVAFFDFMKTYRAAGESAIVELSVEGEKNVNVLIQDTQLDPLSGNVTHADLLQVRMDEEIEAHIPLTFVGESDAVKSLGGMLLKNTDEVLVSCLPADLPHDITVDISALATFDDHIKVSDLKISSKVKMLSEPDMIIAGVTPPRTAAQIAELDVKAEADVTKVESVVKEDKAESK
ncbi:MAG: 50S ribosomal protein L25 [Methylobacter sp.]|uniref:50S ribosomal protein L25 n=1 Tax=Methylobacter sp. TaxID=2051955 RepID=UPI0025FA9DFA|nr:50S ribosomal protein L25 [Methylobacter sp.]MCK9623111.1 50S ribosomal protein L25 [Methylobacter sp.]